MKEQMRITSFVSFLLSQEIDERMMNNANEAAVDARAITQQMAKNKEINDELLQKWIKTYLNREVVGG